MPDRCGTFRIYGPRREPRDCERASARLELESEESFKASATNFASEKKMKGATHALAELRAETCGAAHFDRTSRNVSRVARMSGATCGVSFPGCRRLRASSGLRAPRPPARPP